MSDDPAPLVWRRAAPAADTARLAASFDLMRAVLDGTGLAETLEMIAVRARDMARARLAFVALPEADGNVLRVDVAVGPDAEEVRGLTVRRGRSVIGRVYASGRPLSARVASDQALSGLPAGPILLMPLETGEAVRGVLAVVGRPGEPPLSGAAARGLCLFASTAAALVELAEERRADRQGDLFRSGGGR
ncbi:GAF domain-containing protein [Spirillospora sp. NPDC127200]